MREYLDSDVANKGASPRRQFNLASKFVAFICFTTAIALAAWLWFRIAKFEKDLLEARQSNESQQLELTAKQKEISELSNALHSSVIQHRDDLVNIGDRVLELPRIARPAFDRAAALAIKNKLVDINFDARLSGIPKARPVDSSTQIAEVAIENAGDVTTVRFKATDLNGQFIDSLSDHDVVIRYDGQPVWQQRISVERRQPSAAVATAVLLDRSLSMEGPKLLNMKAGAKRLVRKIANPGRVRVWTFASDVVVISPWTIDASLIESAIDGIKAGGATAINAAIVGAVAELRSLKGKRAIILFTDGRDSDGSKAMDTAIRQCVDESIPIHIVALSSPEVDRNSLVRICNSTGGKLITVESMEQLEHSLAAAGEATLEPTYVLSFLTPRSAYSKLTLQVSGLSEVVVVDKQTAETAVTQRASPSKR